MGRFRESSRQIVALALRGMSLGCEGLRGNCAEPEIGQGVELDFGPTILV